VEKGKKKFELLQLRRGAKRASRLESVKGIVTKIDERTKQGNTQVAAVANVGREDAVVEIPALAQAELQAATTSRGERARGGRPSSGKGREPEG
jgi:hypothetical protein